MQKNKPDLKEGDRIELLCMPNDPTPIPPGTKGVVEWVQELGGDQYQVAVKWENGRRLMLIIPEDTYIKL